MIVSDRVCLVTFLWILLSLGNKGFCFSDLRKVPSFQSHTIEASPNWSSGADTGQGILADIDGDGDLDFAVGKGHWHLGEPKNHNFYWYKNNGAGQWQRKYIGEGFSDACGTAIDVNKDGKMDLLSGHILFINQGQGESWQRHTIGNWGFGCHDMVAADLNQDGRMDVLVHTYSNQNGAEGTHWFEAPSNPTSWWKRHTIIGAEEFRYHAGAFPQPVGDLDGDGDLDIATAKYWVRNDGHHQWTLQELPNPKIGGTYQKWGWAVRTVVKDIDQDGDLDIIQSSCDHGSSEIAWIENRNGKFSQVHQVQHSIPYDLHTLWVEDYDHDGDYDIISAAGAITSASDRKVFVLENTAGAGQSPKGWLRHTILEGHECHNGLAGDVDRDGDIDFISKSWKGETIGRGFYYLENKVVY